MICCNNNQVLNSSSSGCACPSNSTMENGSCECNRGYSTTAYGSSFNCTLCPLLKVSNYSTTSPACVCPTGSTSTGANCSCTDIGYTT